ncbi:MAG: NADH-quinone oxidoreductase subunit C [Acidimicrobiia bacterium]|nr:NADH-quinone oxidoreductase subunit C [Acidimicrobiia bacterium]
MTEAAYAYTTPTDALVAKFAGSVAIESHGQSVVHVDKSSLADVVEYLRVSEEFTMCLDVTAVDHLQDVERPQIAGIKRERFEVVVNLISHPRNIRIRLITQVPESDTSVPTLTSSFSGTSFPEREVYDMFGITFEGHPDLTRILMPDEWVGHPLRKDDAPARVPVTFKGDPGPR